LESPSLGIGDIDVTRSNYSANGLTGYTWTVTFKTLLGDLPLLTYNKTAVRSGYVDISEFVQGQANEFVIEPKKASGAYVKDIDAPLGFKGRDVYFTELWTSDASVVDGSHTWHSDGGVALYNGVQYEIQTLLLPSGAHGNYTLTMDYTSNYTTAQSGEPRTGGTEATTQQLMATATAAQIKNALEALSNVETVDVTQATLVNGSRLFYITFTADLGPLPLLKLNKNMMAPKTAQVSRFQSGVTEVQTVTTAGDEFFVREVQVIRVPSGAGGKFRMALYDTNEWTSQVSVGASAATLKTALESLSSVTNVSVTSGTIPTTSDTLYAITFYDPIGDVPDIILNQTAITGG